MATTREQNDRLTQVGPGTPMGNLLRRYWQPVAAAIELDGDPVRKVRFLGEDLTLYRSSAGEYGLIEDRCAHRCMSLEFGIPDDKGLRCAYHGWVYDGTGQCVEQPFEDRAFPDANYKDRIKVTAYPVRELGGLLFAYFGPLPAPLLPRWDLLVRDDLDVAVEKHLLPCNWLQCMDNAADPVHFEFLHAAFGNYTLKKLGKPGGMTQAKHLKIEFDVFRFGIMKRRLLEGEDPETSDDWRIGHPLIFPNLLAVGAEGSSTFQYRVPVDDTYTLQIAYRTTKRKPGAEPLPITVKYSELFTADGKLVADSIPKQDMTGWVGQGPISDRTREHLTASDKGVILYHKLLSESMDKVERGEDPMGIIRDPADNEPMVDIHREQKNLSAFDVQYGNYFEKIRSLADIRRVKGAAQPLRLGVAGLGVASTMFLPGVEAYPHARVVAAADPRPAALAAFAERYGAQTYDSVEALCADPDVDVVWVATPNQFHCEHTILAAEHRKHVICTKPMALSVDEAQRMCEAAERNGVQLLCGQTWSMSPDVQALWQVAKSGELGRLIAINVWLSTDWLLKPRMPEELDEALGGGVVYRHAPHLIDTVRLLGGGRVRSVRASVGRWMPERPCPGNFSAYLEFEDGTPATIAYNGYGYFDTSELTWGIGNRLYTDEQRVAVRRELRAGTFDNDAAKEEMRFGASGANGASNVAAAGPVGTRAHIGWFGITVASFERGDVRQSPNGIYVYDANGRREVPVTGGRGTGMLEMREMYDCLTGGTPIVHDGRWALGTLEVGMAILESGRTCREIVLEHQTALV